MDENPKSGFSIECCSLQLHEGGAISGMTFEYNLKT